MQQLSVKGRVGYGDIMVSAIFYHCRSGHACILLHTALTCETVCPWWCQSGLELAFAVTLILYRIQDRATLT